MIAQPREAQSKGKFNLELPPIDVAYDLIMKNLETRRLDNDGDAGLIAQAVAALKALQKPAV